MTDNIIKKERGKKNLIFGPKHKTHSKVLIKFKRVCEKIVNAASNIIRSDFNKTFQQSLRLKMNMKKLEWMISRGFGLVGFQSGRHLAEDDVDRRRHVHLLDLSLLKSRNCVRVHKPDSESGQNFFLGFRFSGLLKSSWQRCRQSQRNLVSFPPNDHILRKRDNYKWNNVANIYLDKNGCFTAYNNESLRMKIGP